MNQESLEHYYGDTVRMLFIVGGLVMLASFPFFTSFIGLPVPFSIAGCIALAILAGLMNPQLKSIMLVNMLISIIAFVFFEYYAVYAYLNLPLTQNLPVTFFWVNQGLALIFFFASYLSTKTFRSALLSGKE